MNKKLIESLAKLAKVENVEDFMSALKSETDESNYDFSNLTVFTSEEKENYKKNILDNVDTVPDNLKSKIFKDAFEIQIKNMKKDLGLDFEGKRQEDFIESFKSKILEDAKLEPNQKVKEQETIIESLRSKLETKETEFEGFKSEMQKEKRLFEIKSKIPDVPQNIGLSKDEVTQLYLAGREFKEDGIYVNGKRQVDNMEKSLDVDSDINSWFKGKGWSEAAPAGRGGGAGNKGAGAASTLPTNMDEYKAYIAEKGFSEGSSQANAILFDIAKKHPEILD